MLRRRGNVLSESPLPDEFRAELERLRPELGSFASRVHYFTRVPSTNDIAAGLLPAASNGTVVFAEEQTAGRGRRGRVWLSPAGAGLYVSVICRGNPSQSSAPVPRASLLTIMAGVALADAIRTSSGLDVEIKWPNDLYVGGRKVAGILAEAVASPREDIGPVDHVVLGYGINVCSVTSSIDLPPHATSLEAELGRSVDRALLWAESLAAIASGRRDLQAGRFDAILTRWRVRARSSVGRLVEWLGSDGVRRGQTAGIDDDGALLVQTGPGTERIVGGEVRWL
jgi:BirA family biotin operon repressor/biotin-[acetyl-CoA-carboxylase] ligase